MNELKKTRSRICLTQQQAAEYIGISIRSYKSYENEPSKEGTLKYNYMLQKLSEANKTDETHGILETETIIKVATEIFKKYNINFCYLFGSYAKSSAGPESDIDLLISSDLKGLKYFSLIEELRSSLGKKIDALDIVQLRDNFELTKEILKDGIKIYG